jgi:hypothetical protein
MLVGQRSEIQHEYHFPPIHQRDRPKYKAVRPQRRDLARKREIILARPDFGGLNECLI